MSTGRSVGELTRHLDGCVRRNHAQDVTGPDVRFALRAGVEKLARAVRVTMGPRGRNVVLGSAFGELNELKPEPSGRAG